MSRNTGPGNTGNRYRRTFVALMAATGLGGALASMVPLAARAADRTIDGGASLTVTTNQSFGYVTVGNHSTGTLNVESGGALSTRYGNIGESGGSDGTVTVTGAGSNWTNAFILYVGLSGSGTLNIEAGGAVSDYSGVIALSAGSDGTVTVSGADSTWTNTRDLQVGSTGIGTMHIEDGGGVSNLTVGYVGLEAGSGGTVTVTGAGSKWTNSSSLFVGYGGDGTLTIAAAGTVEVNVPGKSLTLARNSGSSGTLNIGAAFGDAAAAAGTLDAATLKFGDGTGTLVFNHTDTDYDFAADISGYGVIQQFSGVTNLTGDSSGFTGITYVEGGTLAITGSLAGAFGRVGDLGGSNGAVTVAGAGASWTPTSLRVGNSGAGTLTISDGGAVNNSDAVIGYNTGSHGTVTVTGGNSVWTSSTGFTIGRRATGTLTILDGATASAGAASILGDEANGNGTMKVSGAGSNFAGDDHNLTVGNEGTGVLDIENGGIVGDAYGFVGNVAGSTGTVTVDGAGSTWTNSGTVVVGNSGTGTLKIVNGGTVTSATGYVGNSSGSSGTVTVDGSNSSWTNSQSLTISEVGAGSLNITNGGTVSNTYGFVGNESGANGTVTVAGVGSEWTSSQNLFVGNLGTGTLTIADGGAVSASDGSKTVFLASDVASTGTINIGAAAGDAAADAGTLTANSLAFGDGTGTLVFNHTDTDYEFSTPISGSGTIKQLAGGTRLTGDSFGFTGTTMITGGSLTVDGTTGGKLGGSMRAANGAFSIENGGLVASALDSVVGSDETDVATATVTGAGSTWTNASDLFIGDFGTGTMTIADGGSVSDIHAYVGNQSGSTGTVTVTGAGSTWDHNSLMSIGHFGEGVLNVENGGSVSAEDGYVGNRADSDGTVTVSGTGSIWTASNTVIGDEGTGRITIADGGALVTDGGTLGAEAGTGIATVTGSGSKWTNLYRLTIGNEGTGTMTIADGGTVRSNLGTVDIAPVSGSTGTLNIGAAAGHAAAGAGTLEAETLAFGAGTGTLNFNHTETAYTFSSDMTGQGTVNNLAGMTNLTGDSSGFSGTTNVAGGTLSVNTTLGGAVDVTGGVLGGNGTLDEVTVSAGGTVAPGNSIGTMNVATATFARGATYAVQLTGGGFTAGTHNDLLSASGAVTITGGTVDISAENGAGPSGTFMPGTYTIITAAGGRTGVFDSVTDDFALLDFSLSYDAGDVYLTSTLGDCPSGLTANQTGACANLEGIGGGSFYGAALGVSNADLAGALDIASGEIHASGQHVIDQTFSLFSRTLRRQASVGAATDAGGGQVYTAPLAYGRSSPAGPAVAAIDDAAGVAIAGTSTGEAWLAPLGGRGTVDADGNAGALDWQTAGLAGGFEGPVDVATGDTRLGFGLGYLKSRGAVDDRLSDMVSESFNAGLYGTVTDGAWTFSGALAYAASHVSTTRRVVFTGFDQTADANHWTQTAGVSGEAAYGLSVAPGITVSPLATLDAGLSGHGAFAETSAGGADLSVDADTRTRLDAGVGVMLAQAIEMDGATASLEVRAVWEHAFSDTVPSETLALAGSSAGFAVSGPDAGRDRLRVGAGISCRQGDDLTFRTRYYGLFSGTQQSHTVTLGLDLTF